MIRIVGAILIVVGCGAVGFVMVSNHRKQVQCLMQMLLALEYMECELQYKMTSLPELCDGASKVCNGWVKTVLSQLCTELDAQIIPNAPACMYAVINRYPNIPQRLYKCLAQLGECLGQFDLSGQLRGIASVRKRTEFELEQLCKNQDVRLRSYQTLGLCAGAALVVLFL